MVQRVTLVPLFGWHHWNLTLSLQWGFFPIYVSFKIWFVQLFECQKEGSVAHLYLPAVKISNLNLMRFVAMRHYCFRACFFYAGAGIGQSTISEGYDGTVKTVKTCREWIICTAYASIPGWDESHLQTATSAPWVWMHVRWSIRREGKGS